MKNKLYLFILTGIMLLPTGLFSEENGNIDNTIQSKADVTKIEREQRAVLAMTNSKYPVTPGDVYSISYIQAGAAVNFTCIIDSEYSVNLGFFGTLPGKDKTFVELKKDITDKISWAFPESFPNVNIINTGVFEIFLTGEVKRARLINVWGLSRLSDIVETNATNYTSYRNILITAADGKTERYDLYKAWHDGDLTQNPLLVPGSTINFTQFSRRVTISGEVKRPGTYQLLDSDNLSTLIDNYSNDFTDKAHQETIIIQQATSEKSDSGGDTRYVNYKTEASTPLLNRDRIIVRSKDVFLPIFYIEGAVGLNNAQTEGGRLSSSNTIPINFQPNTWLSTLLLSKKELFSETSDLENSYYIRASDNRIININLADIIYDYELAGDLTIESGDKLIIPFKQLFVTVNGAVVKPGRYPYVPNKSNNYYVTLAGGFDTFRNSGDVVSVYDKDNVKQSNDRTIEQEDVITAETNSFSYGLKEFAPLITVLSSMAGIVISVITLVQ